MFAGFIIAVPLLIAGSVYAATMYSTGAMLQPNDVKTVHIRDGNVTASKIDPTGAFTFASSTIGTLYAGSITATSTFTAGATTTFNGNTYIWPTASGTASQLLQAQGGGAIAWTSVTLSKFGGTGADGALNISTGTTTIDMGGASVYTKNYSSISITGSGVLAFTNASTTGTYIKLLSQGACTLTSTSTPMINAIGMGGAYGAGGSGASNTWGAAGSVAANSPGILDTTAHGGGGGSNGTGGAAGSGTFTMPGLYTSATSSLETRVIRLFAGIGGSGGAGGQDAGGGRSGDGGAGGRGGPVLYMECGGAWNFTTTNGISVKGNVGSNGGSIINSSGGGGGGAGGQGGVLLALYNSLTANTGTVNVAGGTGGSGSGGTASNGGGGGGSAGNLFNTGTAGSNASGANGGNGATGISGYSMITANLWWL